MRKLWSLWFALPSWVHVIVLLVSLYYIASHSVVYVEPGNISSMHHSDAGDGPARDQSFFDEAEIRYYKSKHGIDTTKPREYGEKS